MLELFTGPAKERCSLNVLHNLILKHHIAGLRFRALNSSCHGDWPWLLSGDLCDSSVECWVMSLVLIVGLPSAGLSLIFVLTGKKPAPKCPTDCVRAGCDSAGTTLNQTELQVFHTVVAKY